MRLGEKSKKALRIGAKLVGAGAVVAGGARLASKTGDPQQPMVGSYSPESNPSSLRQGAVAGGGLPSLVGKTSELRSGASDFADLASQLRQQQQSRSGFSFFG